MTIRHVSGTGQFVSGEYHFWVQNVSHSNGTGGSFEATNAHVAVGQDDQQLASFSIRDASEPPSRDIWYVVKILIDSDGNVMLTTVQQFEDGSPSTIL